jgi:hypothetical protein
MNFKLTNARNKAFYNRDLFIVKTIAGFIILATGITVLLKGVWLTTPIGNGTWLIILSVGMMLIIIGALAISYK